MHSPFHRRSIWKQFIRREQGTVAILFALSAIPLLLVIGAALDYLRSVQGKTGLQAALDGAALAVAQAEAKPVSVKLADGRQYFRRNLRIQDFEGEASIDIKILSDRVVAKSTAKVPTTLLKLAGINYLEVDSYSEVNRPVVGKAEVVLVLDYSGSMKDNNKYQRMAKAATKFIEDLTTGLQPGSDVKFGLVPFSDFVAVDLPRPFVIGQAGAGTWTGCTQDRNFPFNRKESSPILGNNATKWGVIHHFWDWKVDLSDKDEVKKICDDFISKNLKTVTLSNDYSGLISGIKSMYPYANTNISLGMEFGWHLISPQEPFTQAKDYADKENHKFVVLLTDGMQTSKGYGPGQDESVEHAEDNLEELCQEMKKKDITVFTIGYDLEDDSTLKRLKDCATPGKFYEPAVSGEDLTVAFADIGATVRASLIYLNK